jgi:hypothetical protein
MNEAKKVNLNQIAQSVEELREATELTPDGVKAEYRGFVHSRQNPYWAKGPAQLIGQNIVLDEDKAEPYFMFEPEDLVFDLVELAEVPQMIPYFVKKHGLLWHGIDDVGTGKCRESLLDWFKAIGDLRFVAGLYRSLSEAVRSGSVEPLRRLGLSWPDEFIESASAENYLEATSLTVADLITKGLEDCRLGLVSTLVLDTDDRGPGAFRLSHSPPHLLASAYASLSMLVARRAKLEECPGCGRLFAPESGKQKYHNKSCANTSRWRRWKDRQDS